MKTLPNTNKKGNFGVLGQEGIALLVFIVVLGVVAITASMFDTTGAGVAANFGNSTSGLCDVTAGGSGTDCNESFLGIMDDGIDGVELFGDFTELIALVIIASVILGLLVFFRGDRR